MGIDKMNGKSMERIESLEIDPRMYQHMSYDQLGIVDQ